MAAKRKTNISEVVKIIVRDRLVQEGLLKPVEGCLHEQAYQAAGKGREHKWVCEQCGLEFDSEMNLKAAQREAKKRLQETCDHNFPEGRVVCSKCGINIDELGAELVREKWNDRRKK